MPELMPATLLVVGVSHHTADAGLRGRLAFSPTDARRLLSASRALDVLGEVMVLSTCNRVECYLATPHVAAADRALRALLGEVMGADLLTPGPHAYRHEGQAAYRHLARVACGLDSLVLGEAEILGQLRAAAALARDEATLGRVLAPAVAAALRAGGRVRAETTLGVGTTSVPTAAVSLGEQALSGLRGKHVVIVGAGHAARLALARVLKRRAGAITVVNRTRARAEGAVGQTAASVLPLHRLPAALADADLVLVAAPGTPWLVTRDALAKDARLVMVDIAMPAAVEPEVGLLPGVRLFGIDDLRGVVAETHTRRRGIVPQAEAIAADEADRAWRRMSVEHPTGSLPHLNWSVPTHVSRLHGPVSLPSS